MNQIICGEALSELTKMPSESVDCIVCSPPYWNLRDYNVDGQLGLEQTFTEYINKLCDIFDEAKRVLKKTGTCWVNLGDTYFGGGNNRGNTKTLSDKQNTNKGALGQVQADWSKMDYPDKCLCQIPSRFAIEMVNRGWILRNEIIWYKRNVMPSSIKDRFTVDFEYVFFFAKSKKYFFETQYEPIKTETLQRNKYGEDGNGKGIYSIGRKRESGSFCSELKQDLVGNPTYTGFNERWQKSQYSINRTCINSFGRNKRCVWDITTKPYREAHFATFPMELPEVCIKAGCPVNGVVLDMFAGSGTTGAVAKKLGRQYVLIELNPNYITLIKKRLDEIPEKLINFIDKLKDNSV